MIDVNGVCALLGAEELNVADGSRQVAYGYAGDFLSFVIGKAPTDCVWFTVMNNVNVCAVATLADVSAVVLCEGVQPDENLLNKVKQQGINLLATKQNVYEAIKRICNVV